MLCLALCPMLLRGQPEVAGRLLEKVICEADESQSYALYVPSNYTADKEWPVLFCFDASARGLMPVDRLRVAAEKYGYLVAGSLTSRNGPWAANSIAAQAMVKDVSTHFPIDPRRIYTTGVSGGARVATALALSGLAKGVIACSGGFPVPDAVPRQVPFAFFGTTGVEDFNYWEMRHLDEELEARYAEHRLVIFDGGHEWASAALMMEAVEWLELQAMKTGAQPKNVEFIETMLRMRLAAVPAQSGLDRWRALRSLAADFSGLADTSAFVREVEALRDSREVKAGLKAERNWETRETGLVEKLGEIALESTTRKQNLSNELRRTAEALEDSYADGRI